ncbi:TPA: hypothetical protein I9786_001446 [Serratia marcescens]|nr:hypothetical protein [Serratia marcescens]HAT5031259.1 hypothetical protein [Serratia marcescens]
MLQWRDPYLRAQLLMGGNNGIKEGIHTGSSDLDLKIQFVLFCIGCKPHRSTAGQTGQQAARPGKNIALTVKIIINLSFSGTIFYLFALRKALPLTYF